MSEELDYKAMFYDLVEKFQALEAKKSLEDERHAHFLEEYIKNPKSKRESQLEEALEDLYNKLKCICFDELMAHPKGNHWIDCQRSLAEIARQALERGGKNEKNMA